MSEAVGAGPYGALPGIPHHSGRGKALLLMPRRDKAIPRPAANAVQARAGAKRNTPGEAWLLKTPRIKPHHSTAVASLRGFAARCSAQHSSRGTAVRREALSTTAQQSRLGKPRQRRAQRCLAQHSSRSVARRSRALPGNAQHSSHVIARRRSAWQALAQQGGPQRCRSTAVGTGRSSATLRRAQHSTAVKGAMRSCAKRSRYRRPVEPGVVSGSAPAIRRRR